MFDESPEKINLDRSIEPGGMKKQIPIQVFLATEMKGYSLTHKVVRKPLRIGWLEAGNLIQSLASPNRIESFLTCVESF